MRIFISWSGDLSLKTGELLRSFLPCMIQDIDVFLSKHDLQSGGRWSGEIAKELEDTSFGILCLTTENENSPWILYEAGALTKLISGKACGLLLGELAPANISGPLSQFQHRHMEQTDFYKLLRDINNNIEKPLVEEQLKLVFEKWWPDLNEKYKKLLLETNVTPSLEQQRSDRELLEEIIERIRGISKLGGPAKGSNSEIRWAKRFTDRIFDALPTSEKSLLEAIITLKHQGRSDDVAELTEANDDDAQSLINKGLLTLNDDDQIRVSVFLTRVYMKGKR